MFGVLTLFTVAASWEFVAMFTSKQSKKTRILAAVASGVILLGFKQGGAWVPVSLALSIWAGALLFLFQFSRDPENTIAIPALAYMGALAYIPINLHFILDFNRPECVLVLLAAISSDTAAYYAGTYFGRNKIWPAVSPKKTWQGSIGGCIGCILATYVFGKAFGSAQEILPWILLGAALNIAAQFGDFFESALKRAINIKDSSFILPGHGGLLDRIDSLLLVIPVYALARLLHPFFQ